MSRTLGKPHFDSQAFLANCSLIWANAFSTFVSFFLSGLFLISFLPDIGNYVLPIIYCACGTPALLSSIENLKVRSFSIDALMTMAGFSSPLIGRGHEGGFLLLLFFLSRELEKKILHKATDSAHLAQLHAPQKVWARKLDQLVPIHIRDVQLGMEIAVHAGEMIPVDGVIISGISEVTTTQLNGELNPSAKAPGDIVYSGSYNQQALLVIRVTKKASESTLERLIGLITSAKSDLPASQIVMEKYQNWYSLAVVVFSLLSLFLIPLLCSNCSFSGPGGSMERALGLLIALSPCAIMISLPACYLSSISRCTRRGVVVKGTAQLEVLPSIRTIAFDKTGTLTEPLLAMKALLTWNAQGERVAPPEEGIRALLLLEDQTLHPIGRSIAVAIRERFGSSDLSFEFDRIEQFPGQGITSVWRGETIFIGSEQLAGKWVHKEILKIALEEGHKWIEEGGTASYGWADGHLFLFCLEEKIRESASQVIDFFKNKGIHTIILSGDRQEQVERVAHALNIDQFYFDLSPRQKFDLISDLVQKTKVMMVGDGINDGPALAKAHLGVAMGGFGESLATESASIVLLKDHIEQLPWLFQQSIRTRNVIHQGWALSLLSVGLGALLALSGRSMIWFSVLLHEGSTILVALNGLRLL
ncbi:heavy metal translocating P-type ATPase [Candidatus Similichlamydia epinepheli]|uniref:heavy metal translocating P-type ATPase n=1 Tax=Candidatus Similichlamydia epinepheli TaxID=1903953 RepID=UPI00130036C0|nr:heavy metal translocating P-type ATPase [Candidatus Similichlamydia epinepheli]